MDRRWCMYDVLCYYINITGMRPEESLCCCPCCMPLIPPSPLLEPPKLIEYHQKHIAAASRSLVCNTACRILRTRVLTATTELSGKPVNRQAHGNERCTMTFTREAGGEGLYAVQCTIPRSLYDRLISVLASASGVL